MLPRPQWWNFLSFVVLQEDLFSVLYFQYFTEWAFRGSTHGNLHVWDFECFLFFKDGPDSYMTVVLPETSQSPRYDQINSSSLCPLGVYMLVVTGRPSTFGARQQLLSADPYFTIFSLTLHNPQKSARSYSTFASTHSFTSFSSHFEVTTFGWSL